MSTWLLRPEAGHGTWAQRLKSDPPRFTCPFSHSLGRSLPLLRLGLFIGEIQEKLPGRNERAVCECDIGQSTRLHQEPHEVAALHPEAERFTGKFKRPRGQARGDLDLLRGARRLRLMF